MVLILNLVIILEIMVLLDLIDDALPLYTIISVYSITIVIRSVYKTCYDRFYLQIYLKNCIYKTC